MENDAGRNRRGASFPHRTSSGARPRPAQSTRGMPCWELEALFELWPGRPERDVCGARNVPAVERIWFSRACRGDGCSGGGSPTLVVCQLATRPVWTLEALYRPCHVHSLRERERASTNHNLENCWNKNILCSSKVPMMTLSILIIDRSRVSICAFIKMNMHT